MNTINISGNEITRASDSRFQELWENIPTYNGDSEDWHNGTGYFDYAKDVVTGMPEIQKLVDKYGRRVIAGRGILIAERYSKQEDPILIAHLFDHKGRQGDAYFVETALQLLA